MSVLSAPRKLPYLLLRDSEIERAIAPVADGAPLASVELQHHGTTNTNYRVTIGGWVDALALRIYLRDPAYCHKELALLTTLSDALPVARVLHADPLGIAVGYPCLVTSWLPGCLLAAVASTADRAATRSLGRTAGAALATLHTLPARKVDEVAAIPGVTGEASSQAAGIDVDRIAGILGHELGRRIVALLPADGTEVRHSLQHGDCHGANILVQPRADGWCVSGLLDWERAQFGDPMADLAVLLRHTSHHRAEFTAGLLDGYGGGGGSIPPDWRRRVRLIDLAFLVETACSPGTEEGRPHGALVARIAALADRLALSDA